MFTSNRIYTIFIGLCLTVAVFASGFFTGQKITRDYYKLEIKDIENTALKLENENLIKKINTETELKNKVNEVIQNAQSDKQSIENAYSVSVSLFDSGLQSYDYRSNEMQLSDNAGTTNGTRPEGASKCNTDNNRDFKRLSKRLLDQAKEYDLLKVRYNTLLSLWKETEKKINNFN